LNNNRYTGPVVALTVVLIWAVHLLFWLTRTVNLHYPVWIIGVFIQAHLYTGLFITAHDAMHGTVSSHKRVNDLLGSIALMLYAAFSYRQLHPEHHKHHKHVATANDPDFYNGNFFTWYISFVKHYLRWWQVVILGTVFNMLHYLAGIPQTNLILFWVIPPLLSTLQLFYFGTYLPHRFPEQIDNRHKSRTQKKNHVWGFLSCYFFGYHYEHHNHPHVPWWMLWKTKSGS